MERGEVVAVNHHESPEELRRESANWAGKIVLLIRGPNPNTDDVLTFAQLGPLVEVAERASALAVIAGDDADDSSVLLHTGPVSFLPKTCSIPVINMVAADHKQGRTLPGTREAGPHRVSGSPS